MHTLRWLRVIGDTIFLTGVASLAWFMLGLVTGWSFEPAGQRSAERVGAEPAVV